MDVQAIKQNFEELQSSAGARGVGRVALTLTAMVLSAFPGVGPVGVLVEKFGSHVADPDIEKHVVALEEALLAIAPELSRIDDLEERVDLLASLLARNEEANRQLRGFVSEAGAALLERFELKNIGGVNRLYDVVIENMKLDSIAAEGGRTTLDRVDHQGPASFETDRHSAQSISRSRFKGRSAGVMTDIALGDALLGPGKVETHVVEGNSVTGLKITRVVGPGDPGGAAMSIVVTNGPRRGR
jgi:hypothetical protein